MARRLAGSSSILLLVVALQTQAAQPQALALFKTGKQLFLAGEYEAAIKSLEASHLRAPHRNNLYYIGESYRRLGKLRLSHSYYERYSALVSDDDRQRMLEKLEQLRWGRTCQVLVRSTPDGASVFIDGHRRGLTDNKSTRAFEVVGGVHQLRLERPGYIAHEASFQAEFGEEIALAPVLSRVAVRPKAVAKSVAVLKRPGVEKRNAPTPAPRTGGPFVQLGLGLGVTDLDNGRGPSAAPGVDILGGYRLALGARFAVKVHGLASLSPEGQGQFLMLLGGLGGQLGLAPRLWLEVSLSIGLSLLFGADAESPLFKGAEEVSGPFSTFAIRPALALDWLAWRSLYLGLSPSLDYNPRHADFTADVSYLLRYRVQAHVGWCW